MGPGRTAVLNGMVTEGFPEKLRGGLLRAPAPSLFFVFLFGLFAWGCEVERWLSPHCEGELCEDAVVTLLSISEGNSVQEESDTVVQDRLVPLGAQMCPLCDKGDIIASMCLSVPPVPRLPLRGVLRVPRFWRDVCRSWRSADIDLVRCDCGDGFCSRR